MATQKIRNISGVDLVVPLPDGGRVVVEANHQGEFEADHAKSLLQQSEIWEKVDKPKTDKDGD